MYEICAYTFLEGTFMCISSFLVCVRLTTCACARTGYMVHCLQYSFKSGGLTRVEEYMLIVWLIEPAGFLLPLLLPSTVLAAVKFLLL